MFAGWTGESVWGMAAFLFAIAVALSVLTGCVIGYLGFRFSIRGVSPPRQSSSTGSQARLRAERAGGEGHEDEGEGGQRDRAHGNPRAGRVFEGATRGDTHDDGARGGFGGGRGPGRPGR